MEQNLRCARFFIWTYTLASAAKTNNCVHQVYCKHLREAKLHCSPLLKSGLENSVKLQRTNFFNSKRLLFRFSGVSDHYLPHKATNIHPSKSTALSQFPVQPYCSSPAERNISTIILSGKSVWRGSQLHYLLTLPLYLSDVNCLQLFNLWNI